MKRIAWRCIAAVLFAFSMLGAQANAAPPTFRINEVYTNPTGEWQFVEMIEYAGLDGQNLWAGLTMSFTGPAGATTFTFPQNLPTEHTAHLSVIVWTLYPPDPLDDFYGFIFEEPGRIHYYALPKPFLDTRGGSLDFAGADALAIPALPFDGIRAFYRAGGIAPATLPSSCAAAPCSREPYGSQVVGISEFYNRQLNAFLPTIDPVEIAALSDGRIPGWQPATEGFSVLTIPQAPYDAPVCRYWAPGGGHILTAFANECALLATLPGFILESAAAFYVELPDPVTGACAHGTPVYRLWNSANGADHRYTVYGKTMVLVGPILGAYVREGYGPDGVGFCAVYQPPEP